MSTYKKSILILAVVLILSAFTVYVCSGSCTATDAAYIAGSAFTSGSTAPFTSLAFSPDYSQFVLAGGGFGMLFVILFGAALASLLIVLWKKYWDNQP